MSVVSQAWWRERLARAVLTSVACAVVCLAPAAAAARSPECPGGLPNSRGLAGLSPESPEIPVGCPFASPPGRPKVTVRVLKWCNLPGPHRQVLWKLKVSIHNGSSHTVSIGVPHWRLLVSQFVQGRWTPPPSPFSTGRPVVVRWAGRAWWAVPANPDGAAEPDPFQPPGIFTFATHWDGKDLRPGKTYVRPQRYKGDLVFYVPMNDPNDPKGNILGEIALAYFIDRKPTVVVPFDQWEKEVAAAAF